MNYKQKYFLLFISFLFTIFFLNVDNNFANNNSKINIYIKNSKELKSEKKKSQKSSAKFGSQEIKHFLKKSSDNNKRGDKKDIELSKNMDSGMTTKKMIQENRWFVKKPFKKSFNKISNIKRVALPKNLNSKNESISLKVSELSRNRARDTGYIKPEIVFSKDSSRTAKLMSKTQTDIAGPAKTGPVFSEESSRLAKDFSKTRARETGPVKPKIIYSEKVSRDVYQMSSKKNKNKIILKKKYSGKRYSVEFLRSLSRKSSFKNESLKGTSIDLEENNGKINDDI